MMSGLQHDEPPRQPVLLTGAAGLIGAAVATQLLANRYSVVAVDNLSSDYDVSLKRHRLERLRTIEPFCDQRFSFHEADVTNRAVMEQIFEEYAIQSIIHLAGRAGIPASVASPLSYFTTNAVGTLTLLELARLAGVKKFVFGSTSSLYSGQQPPFVETMPVDRPISPYSTSKRSAELNCFTYHHLYDIDVAVLRYFTVYGPAGRPDMAVFRFMHAIASNQPIELFGTGDFKRDFTYVDDVAVGTAAALNLSGFQVVNLGYGQPFSIIELIQSLEAITGRSAKINFHTVLPVDMPVTWANIDVARQCLGWQPQVDLQQGLAATWQWYQQQHALNAPFLKQ